MSQAPGSERWLQDALGEAAPDFEPIQMQQLRARRHDRNRRRLAPVVAAAVVVLVAAVLLTVRSGGTDSTTGNRISQARLSTEAGNTLARKAPCTRTRTGTELAHQHQIAALDVAAAVECLYVPLTYPDGTRWHVLIRQVSVAGVPALVEALTQPDDHTPLPKNSACGAIGYAPLAVLLSDKAGRHYLHPAWPATTCGGPPAAVDRAVSAMVWRTVSITKLQRLPRDIESSDGCAIQGLSQIPGAAPAGGNPPGSGHELISGVARRICLYYAVDDRGDGDLGRLFDKVITRAEWNTLNEGFAGNNLAAPLRTGATCPNQNSYLIVHQDDGRVFTVEVGGCWRVVLHGPHPQLIGTASPSAQQAVRKVLSS